MTDYSEAEKVFKKFTELLNKVGRLHDSKVSSVVWEPVKMSVVLTLDDLYANFLDLPEYPGKLEATFLFAGVSNVSFIGEAGSCIAINDCYLNLIDEANFSFILQFWPSGVLKIYFSNATWSEAASHLSCSRFI